ncbi:MAG: zinc-dependent metalloprotease, partial [Planctomycetota bacterium]
DDGVDAAQALRDALAVRAAALARFGEGALARGRALSELEQVLVPLYFHHRYQVDAAAALVGGRVFAHEVRGAAPADGIRPLEASRQRDALAALLEALAPEALALPDEAQRLIPPPAPGAPRDRERFDPGAELFDPLQSARAAASLVFDRLLDPDRLARVAVQSAADPEQLSLVELFDALEAWGWGDPPQSEALALVRREARGVLLDRVFDLLAEEGGSDEIRLAWMDAVELNLMGASWSLSTPLNRVERLQFERFLRDPQSSRSRSAAPRVPPGPPIGCGGDHFGDLTH